MVNKTKQVMHDTHISPVPDKQIIVCEASAGSGKTYALAKRYVELILSSSELPHNMPFRNILAITFTNKAATEMKARIIEFLKKIALDTFNDEDEKRRLYSGLPDRGKSTKHKAGKTIDSLLGHYHYFQVRTIDSLVNSLLIGCSLRLGLSSHFSIQDYCNDYLEFSLDSLIDKVMEDSSIKRIFETFLEQYLFIEGKEGWLVKKDILSLLGFLFAVHNIYGKRFKKSVVENADLIQKRKSIIKLMKKIEDTMPEATNKTFQRSLYKIIHEKGEGFDIDDLGKTFARSEFPANKNAEVPVSLQALWERLTKSITELCEWESGFRFNCYIDIFDAAYRLFADLSTRDDVLFLEEMNRKACIVHEDDSVTVNELYYRLATRFSHFLIDEFQDTSLLQWNNLYLMIEEALSTGGSLFCVGDKKQSIYRFRGGERRLFDEVGQAFNRFEVSGQSLNTNYRSRKEIVDFNNGIFSQENLRRFLEENFGYNKGSKGIVMSESDMNDVLNVFHGAGQGCDNEHASGYVEIDCIDAEDRDERDDLVKKKLLTLLKSLKDKNSGHYSDIAILARSNDDIALVTSWLVEAGIPVESEKTMSVKEQRVIKEIIAFLTFLNSPIDNIAFASFLLGDIFSRASGIDKKQMREFIFSQRDDLLNRKKRNYIYITFRRAYPEKWDRFISSFLKKAGIAPLYEFVISIFSQFNVVNTFPEYQGFLLKFLEFVKEHEDRYSGLASFLEFFENALPSELYIKVGSTNAVKVQNIHQSKGLEFGTVIFPFLTMLAKVGPVGGMGQRGSPGGSFVVRSDGESLVLQDVSKKYIKFSSAITEMYASEFKKALIDELNVMYVALTRARNELYAFLPKKVAASNNIAQSLISDKKVCFGKQAVYKAKKEDSKYRPIPIAVCQPGDWMRLMKDQFTAGPSLDEIIHRRKISAGVIYHFILSSIGRMSRENEKSIFENAMEKTRLKYPSIDDMNSYGDKVRAMLSSKALKKFFFVDDGKVHCEKDIVRNDGKTRRVDRLIVRENEIQVIDYKSSKGVYGKDDHAGQINNYKEILRDIYPERVIRGFLIYIDDIEVEEVL